MPSRRRVSLSSAAQGDLRAILQYTLERQGAEQRRIVRDRFAHVLRELAAFPNLGRARDDILPGIRGLPVANYIILYNIEDDRVRVNRILHEKMDVGDLNNYL
ncbi:MAG TPA: type II toxin-antitoxin system RelE/ParE family toxin [Thermomicrobiales bacterium]|nr:type II toxin-antitoxin system RelE/ParE family toxin [Thermomicrobiales bacterium]